MPSSKENWEGWVRMSYPQGRGDGLLCPDPHSCSLHGVVGVLFGKHPWLSPRSGKWGGKEESGKLQLQTAHGGSGLGTTCTLLVLFCCDRCQMEQKETNAARERSLCSSPEVRNIPQIRCGLARAWQAAVPSLGKGCGWAVGSSPAPQPYCSGPLASSPPH